MLPSGSRATSCTVWGEGLVGCRCKATQQNSTGQRRCAAAGRLRLCCAAGASTALTTQAARFAGSCEAEEAMRKTVMLTEDATTLMAAHRHQGGRPVMCGWSWRRAGV